MLVGRRPGVRLALALALCTAAFGSLSATSSAKPIAPSGFLGISAWGIPSANEFARMAQGKAGFYRALFWWQYVEPTQGARNWAIPDAIVGDAARGGVQVIPLVYGSPSWAASKPEYPPMSRNARTRYKYFVRDIARRYGRGGAFWKANPGLRYRPIPALQAWNEPNLGTFWRGQRQPKASEYAALLRDTYNSIPRSTAVRTVLAGIPDAPGHKFPGTNTRDNVRANTYVSQLYSYMRKQKSYGKTIGQRLKYFYAVAIHAYGKPSTVEARISGMRAVMNKYGDSRKPLWVTEFGWASSGPNSAYTTTERGQQLNLIDAVKRARNLGNKSNRRRRYGVQKMVWFAWRDRGLIPGEKDWWGPHTGLFKDDGFPKPVWSTFAYLTGGKAGSGPIAGTGGTPGGGNPGPPKCYISGIEVPCT